MKTKGVKIIASMLVFVLTFTYISIMQEAFATVANEVLENNTIVVDGNTIADGNTISGTISNQEEGSRTGNKNVDFDIYFEKTGENKYGAVKQIGEQNYLYAKVVVKEGYLKSSTISFANPNFKITGTEASNYVSSVTENSIAFSRIPANTEVEIQINIEPKVGEKVAGDCMYKQNSANFSSEYVDKNGTNKTVTGVATVGLAWDTERTAEFDISVENVIPYTGTDSKKYVIVQFLANAKLENNTLPLVSEKIEINLPIIDNKKLQEVVVSAITTKQINGEEEAESFSSANYSYNEEQNKLLVEVNNIVDENGNISWKKNAEDKYIITAVYDAENINLETSNYSANCTGKVTLTLANRATVSKEIEKTLTISTENTKNIVEYEIKANTEKVSKGQIYANYNRTEKLETEYEEVVVANITYAEMVEKITINQSEDNFVNENTIGTTTYNGINYAYFKTLSIGKANFEKILGEDGEISIYNGTTLLAKINKNSTQNSANNYEINLSSYNVNELKIETTKPIAEGKLLINIKKAIKGEIGYNINQMKLFTDIKLNLTANTSYSNILTAEETTKSCEIEFIEPQTKAELTIDTPSLSTIVENKDVKLTVVLRTDSLEYSLYRNPTIQITFPSYVENVNIKDINLYFETEGNKLTANGSNLIENEDGTTTLEIALEGTQTEYTLGAVSKGINIAITADITVNKLTANKQDEIVMTYTNNYIEEEQKIYGTPIEVVAPTGVVTVSTISNYAENAEEVTVVSEEARAVIVETMEDARVATLGMSVINNYNNTLENVVILGRTLFEGNKEIINGTDMGSNIDMPLASTISVNGTTPEKIKIYYSENETATKDLSIETNGWTLFPEDLSNVKSYLIVLEDYTMETGNVINFGYNVNLPANMEYNKTAMQEYVVYFSNNLATGTIADKEASTIFGLTTGQGAVLEASLTSNLGEDVELTQGQNVTYTLTVKNIGTKEAKNVIANVECPSGITVAEGSSRIELGDIPANSQITKEIVMEAENVTEDTKKLETKVRITSESIKNVIVTNSVFSTIAKTYYMTSTIIYQNTIFKEGDEFTYCASVVSTERKNSRENTTATFLLPTELEVKDVIIKDKGESEDTDITSTITYNYDKSNNTFVVNLGTVDGYIIKDIELKLVVGKLADGVYYKNTSINATVQGDGTRIQSLEEQEIELGKIGVKVSQTSSITENSKISTYEDFKYIFEIENLSNMRIYNLELKDFLPQGLTYASSKITYSESSSKKSTNVDSEGNPVIAFNLEAKEKIKIEVSVYAKELTEDTKISNKASIYYNDEVLATSNTISHTIAKYEGKTVVDPTNPTNPEDAITKRISGQVWYDTSKDGIKDEDEVRVKDVEVILFNNISGAVVTDSNGKMITQTTAEDGTYTFTGIPQGRYTVIFLYDTANYSATTYQMEGVDESKNSDAIDTNITVGGETRLAGITEEIVVTNSNIYNIDLGLLENPKFDLSLNKVVSKITVQDSTQTETTDYNGTKLAKKDLVGNKINDTTIIVEYKIQVKNEGAIAGYVKKVVDYMPTEMKFNTELNTDWYQGANGEIYNASLANTLIKPGETKELTLILTKKMTEDTLGLINNTAEIFESYNDLGLKDCDSTVSNKNAKEDDISSADILITVKTGEVVAYVGLSIGIIAVIGLSAIIIKKKVLN